MLTLSPNSGERENSDSLKFKDFELWFAQLWLLCIHKFPGLPKALPDLTPSPFGSEGRGAISKPLSAAERGLGRGLPTRVYTVA